METIISWCNSNNGFLTAILAFLSLLLSSIAIVVSIMTARLPYMKRIKIATGHYFTTYGETGLHVTITNIGQRQVHIDMIGFLVGGRQIFNKEHIFENQKTLSCSESTAHRMPLRDIQETLVRSKFANNVKVYAFVKDSEDETHKKYFGKVGDVLSYES